MKIMTKLFAPFLLAAAAASPVAAHPVEDYAWSFFNFISDPCVPGMEYYSWDLYQQTFIGIPGSPVSNLGFDYGFYKAAYQKKIGETGTCYGMVLMSLLINDKGGHLGYCGPVGQYSGDLIGTAAPSCKKGGKKFLGPTDPNLRRALKEMHGHQLNLAEVRLNLEQIATGEVHHADVAFDRVLQHQPCIVSLIKDASDLFGAGHTILGYDAKVVGSEKRIYVYDPNRTWAVDDANNRGWYLGDQNFISIDSSKNWHFQMAGGETWSSPTGLIAIIPLSIAGPRDRTPASMGNNLVELLDKIFLSGDGASLAQVTDSKGKVLFQPGTKSFETDPAKGMLNIAPLLSTDGEAGAAPIGGIVAPPDGERQPEQYLLTDHLGGALDFDILAGANGYELEIASRRGSIRIRAQGGRGMDRVRVQDPGTLSPRLALLNLAGAENYQVELSKELRSGERSRSFKLHRVSMPVRGLLEIRLTGDGQGLDVVSPTGTASFDLELVQSENGADKTAWLPGVGIGPGDWGHFEPESWNELRDGEVRSVVQGLPVPVLEAYCDALRGPGRGPVGADFENSRDLGAAAGGRTSFDARSQVYTQVSSGLGAGNGGDSLQYAYRTVGGDFEFTVEVLDRAVAPGSLAPTALCGLMARRDCSPASKESFLATPAIAESEDWPRWNYRRFHGDPSTDDRLRYNYAPDQAPRFLKLVRHRNTFHGFLSRDGQDWRPIGSDTWYGEAPESEVLVGFASATGAAGLASSTRFRVHGLGPIDPALELPLPDQGGAAGEVIYQNRFQGRDGAPPEEMSANRRDGVFLPRIRGGRLRLSDEAAGDSSTSAFAARLLEGVDQAIFRFDFDLFLARAAGQDPGEGVTFAVSGGSDLSRVGFRREALGYEGLGRDLRTGENLSRNGFAIEFDTLKGPGDNEGTGSPEAPRSLHVGIDGMNNVNTLVQASPSGGPGGEGAGGLPDPFAPEGVHVTVVYNRGRVEVYLASNGVGGAVPAKALEASLLPISFAAVEDVAVFGFTASTGGLTQTAEVDNLVATRIGCNDIQEVAAVEGVPAQAVPLGALITLDGSVSNGGPGEEDRPVTHLWSVVSGGAGIIGPNDGPTVNLETRAEGPVTVKLTVDDGACENAASKLVTFSVAGRGNWIRCDSNGDRVRDVTDPIFLLSWLFLGEAESACRPAADCQSDGRVDISDAVFDLGFQFLGGPPPAPPYPACDRFEGCGESCR